MNSIYYQLLHSPNRVISNIYYFLCNELLSKKYSHFINLLSLVPNDSPLFLLYRKLEQNEEYQEYLELLVNTMDRETKRHLYIIIMNCINSGK